MSYNLNVKNITSEEWLLTNCKEHSLYILSIRANTEKQLRDKLKKNGKYNDEIINKTIEFLKKHHYIDDIEFTKRFIELNKHNYSKNAIKNKLYIKGVSRSILDEAFTYNDDETEEETCKKLLLKKYPTYYEEKDNMDNQKKQKVLMYLIRKGFLYDTVKKVMKEFID